MASGLWVGGPHPTSGLEGYPARDFGAPGGSPVYAWAPLKVVRISGASGYRGGGFGGYNLYLAGAGGTYFVTHVENVRVKVGDVIRPGQEIAQVGNYGTPHVHLGFTGGDPVERLGLKPEYLFSGSGAVQGSSVVSRNAGAMRSSGLKLPSSIVETGPLGPAIQAGKAVAGVGGQVGVPGAGAVGGVLDAVSAPGDAIRWVFGNWDRMLEVLGGFVLLLIGLILMGARLGLTPKPAAVASGTAGRLFSPDEVETAYRSGEEAGMRSAARSAGRKAGRAAYRGPAQGARTASGDDIPY